MFRLGLSSALLLITCACTTTTFLVPNQAQAEQSHASTDTIKVMIVGTYHFGNPGQDLNNIEADSVLTPARQAELQAMSDSLLSFQPTVVAVEARAPAPYIDGGYADFTAADLLTEPNETVQIGYRLAKQAGLSTVYAVDEQPSDDEPDYFPYGKVAAFAEASGRSNELSALTDMSAFMSGFEAAQATDTIPELLIRMTDFAEDPSFYWDIIKFGEAENQPGAELAAYWFMRNAKIFNKITQVAKPGDRIVVVYGSGHSYWLNELVENTSGYEVEPVRPYLSKAIAQSP